MQSTCSWIPLMTFPLMWMIKLQGSFTLSLIIILFEHCCPVNLCRYKENPVWTLRVITCCLENSATTFLHVLTWISFTPFESLSCTSFLFLTNLPHSPLILICTDHCSLNTLRCCITCIWNHLQVSGTCSPQESLNDLHWDELLAQQYLSVCLWLSGCLIFTCAWWH